jgi:hypothetical protein
VAAARLEVAGAAAYLSGLDPETRRRLGMAGDRQTVTTDHDEIRRWAEAQGGRPARVRATGDGDGDDLGILRIDFPGGAGEEDLEPVSWDESFEE